MEGKNKVTIIRTPNETKVLIGNVDVSDSVIHLDFDINNRKLVELKMFVEKVLIEN